MMTVEGNEIGHRVVEPLGPPGQHRQREPGHVRDEAARGQLGEDVDEVFLEGLEGVSGQHHVVAADV